MFKLRFSIGDKSVQNLAEDAMDSFSQRKRNALLLDFKAVAHNLKLQKASTFDIGYESGVRYLDFDVYDCKC